MVNLLVGGLYVMELVLTAFLAFLLESFLKRGPEVPIRLAQALLTPFNLSKMLDCVK